MKLLTKTTRYYVLLAVALFALGAGALYGGLSWALRGEVDEQLLAQRQQLLTAAARPRPSPLLSDSLSVSRVPLPGGLHDAVRFDPAGRTLVPYRELSFPVVRGGTTVWVTLGISLLETDDLLGVVLTVMLSILGLLLASLVLLNQWLARWLWAPFRHTLRALRSYDLQQRGPLVLPATPIDEFTALNLTLNRMSARLAADYERLKEFTENAAHETQTPLAIMQAQLEQLVQDDSLRPASAVLVGELYGATRRLSRLHQALTLLSKIENQQFAQAAPVRLDRVIAAKAQQLEDLAAGRAIVLHVAVAGVPALTMHPSLADSLVRNLLQNAVKHCLDGSRIEVTLGPTLLSVANPGPVVAGDPARFFERFRKHQAASDSPGLGLAIVQQICHYYGFTLRYDFAAAGAVHTLRVGFPAAAGLGVKS